MSANLKGVVVARAELAEPTIAEMFGLFCEHFDRGRRDIFERDLNGKNWVILLRDEAGGLQGFSTLALYETVVAGSSLSVVYSGDTIIRPAFWGTPELPRMWIKTVLQKSVAMMQPLYWLLISSGYKTYRFLSVFYKEFYPRYDRPTPPEMQDLLNHLAAARFGSDYSPERGVVCFREGATPLHPGVAEITAERLQDPHVAFFVARNPGHARGDELVCLTHIHPDNFTAAGRRMAR